MSLSLNDEGSGFPVVFLHAFPLDGSMWTKNALHMREAGFRTILFDLHGFGKSSGKIHSIAETAAEVADSLMKSGIAKAAICGLSMGGYIAFELFCQYPGLFSAAILCDTTPEADTLEKRESRINAIDEIKTSGTRGFMDRLAETMISSHTFASKAATVLDLRDRFERAESGAVCAALLAMAKRRSSTEMLKDWRIPTLLVFGSDDPMLSDGKMMSAQIPNCELRIIENAGHFSNLEAPRSFNAELTEFLSALDLD